MQTHPKGLSWDGPDDSLISDTHNYHIMISTFEFIVMEINSLFQRKTTILNDMLMRVKIVINIYIRSKEVPHSNVLR